MKTFAALITLMLILSPPLQISQAQTINSSEQDVCISYADYLVDEAMGKLGMEVAASGMLVGINSFRQQHSLVTLRLEKSELDRWNEHDPLADPASASSAH